MREEIGGVAYDDEAELKFGSPETRAVIQHRQKSDAAHRIAVAT